MMESQPHFCCLPLLGNSNLVILLFSLTVTELGFPDHSSSKNLTPGDGQVSPHPCLHLLKSLSQWTPKTHWHLVQ